jgi:hypothetical protein
MDGSLNLQDLSAVIGPDNKLLSNVVEVLATSGHFTEDGIWVASNDFGKHVSAQRKTLPSGEERQANRGVPAAKGVIGQNEDYIGFFESPSVVDDFVLRRANAASKQEFRSKYDIAHGLGLGITQRTKSFYGNKLTNINDPQGFASRRSTIDGIYTLNNAKSAAKNTSLYLVGWDINQGVHHIYPDGEPAGINMQDMGINVVIDPVNVDVVRWIPYWITWFYLDFGIVILEDRAMIRICNIDPDSVTAADYQLTYKLLNQALRLMRLPPEKIRIYGSNAGLTYLDNMSIYIPTVNTSPTQIEDRTYYKTFNGIPLRLCEEILNTETVVS